MKTTKRLGWLHVCLTVFVTLGIMAVAYERHGFAKALLFAVLAGFFMLLLGVLWGSVFKKIYDEGVQEGRKLQ